MEELDAMYDEQFYNLGLTVPSQGATFSNPGLLETTTPTEFTAPATITPAKDNTPIKHGPIIEMVRATAVKYGLDPDYFEGQIWAESNFNPRDVSNVGAMGLGQLMPGTARELGVKDPFDPAENLDGSARYMIKMLRMFDNNLSLALAAYNSGPGRVKRYGGIPPIPETQNYVRKILAYGARRKKRAN